MVGGATVPWHYTNVQTYIDCALWYSDLVLTVVRLLMAWRELSEIEQDMTVDARRTYGVPGHHMLKISIGSIIGCDLIVGFNFDGERYNRDWLFCWTHGAMNQFVNKVQCNLVWVQKGTEPVGSDFI